MRAVAACGARRWFLLMDQVENMLDGMEDPQNKEAIENAVGDIPWLEGACSEARVRWTAAILAEKNAEKAKSALHSMQAVRAQARRTA